MNRKQQWIANSLAAGLAIWLAGAPTAPAQEPLQAPEKPIWQTTAGSGFEPGAKTLTLEAGVNIGLASFGSDEAHNLTLFSLSYGHILGKPVAVDHWYGGNFEVRGELFGGWQFSPHNDWALGLTPHLRYNFVTGTRLVPFFDLGAGVSATSIGPPDLSKTFEFNLQAGPGLHWFFRDRWAITAEARYFHMSCAGLSHPNNGLNGVACLVGLTRLF